MVCDKLEDNEIGMKGKGKGKVKVKVKAKTKRNTKTPDKVFF